MNANMMKKKKQKGFTLPNRFNYWYGWSICKKQQDGKTVCILAFPNLIKTVNSNIYKHKDKLIIDDQYFFNYIAETPSSLEDKTLQRILINRLKEWSSKARFNDSDAIRKIDILNDCLKGNKSGKTKKVTQKLIKRDIEIFQKILVKIEYLDTKRNIISVIKEKGLGKDALKEIRKKYNSPYILFKKCKPPLDDNTFFGFLNTCNNNIDKPYCYIKYGDYVFIKGEVTKQNGKPYFRADL